MMNCSLHFSQNPLQLISVCTSYLSLSIIRVLLGSLVNQIKLPLKLIAAEWLVMCLFYV